MMQPTSPMSERILMQYKMAYDMKLLGLHSKDSITVIDDWPSVLDCFICLWRKTFEGQCFIAEILAFQISHGETGELYCALPTKYMQQSAATNIVYTVLTHPI